MSSSKYSRIWSITLRIVMILAILCGVAYLVAYPSLGGDISGDRLQRVEASPHYRDGVFVNDIPAAEEGVGLWGDYLVEQLFGDQIRVPPRPLPIVPVALQQDGLPPAPGLRAIWLGHASVYLELDGVRLLVDPMFSEKASPFSFVGPTRLHPTPVALDALPVIDAVVISHDHYDHLDRATIKFLATKGTQFFVPLGVGAHLEKWQVPASQIIELDWWETASIKELTITSTPTRHYSGRGLTDANKTFWSSWSMIGPQHRVYYSGDTGYSDHFQTIGDRFGPFDLSIIKIGAYGPFVSWTDIHMEAEDAIRAHLDVDARRLLPVHWATFNLAFHDWNEPIKRALVAAEAAQIEMVTPRLGEVVTAGEAFKSEKWWVD